MTPAQILAQVKQAIREPFAWPGGYPKYIVMADGEALSVEAAKTCWRDVARATLTGAHDGWRAAGVEINWEDGDLTCCHNNVRIPSAYADEPCDTVETV